MINQPVAAERGYYPEDVTDAIARIRAAVPDAECCEHRSGLVLSVSRPGIATALMVFRPARSGRKELVRPVEKAIEWLRSGGEIEC